MSQGLFTHYFSTQEVLHQFCNRKCKILCLYKVSDSNQLSLISELHIFKIIWTSNQIFKVDIKLGTLKVLDYFSFLQILLFLPDRKGYGSLLWADKGSACYEYQVIHKIENKQNTFFIIFLTVLVTTKEQGGWCQILFHPNWGKLYKW